MHINDVVIKVRYGETDQMGIAYHGNYFTWFEVGRSEFFNSLGYTYKKLEEEGIILPVIECSCEYIKPAKYFDEIIIRTKIKSETDKEAQSETECYNDHGSIFSLNGPDRGVIIRPGR